MFNMDMSKYAMRTDTAMQPIVQQMLLKNSIDNIDICNQNNYLGVDYYFVDGFRYEVYSY